MNIATHLKLADHMHHQLQQDGLELPRKPFLVGNIFPDIDPFHKYIRHYHDSMDKVLQMEANLSSVKNSRQYAFRSGMVAHYLTDFLCYPHFNNHTFWTHAKSHVEYELVLNEKAEAILSKLDLFRLNHHDSDKSLEYVLKQEIEHYSNQKDFQEDVFSACRLILFLHRRQQKLKFV